MRATRHWQRQSRACGDTGRAECDLLDWTPNAACCRSARPASLRHALANWASSVHWITPHLVQHLSQRDRLLTPALHRSKPRLLRAIQRYRFVSHPEQLCCRCTRPKVPRVGPASWETPECSTVDLGGGTQHGHLLLSGARRMMAEGHSAAGQMAEASAAAMCPR